jgi:guanylate kinase
VSKRPGRLFVVAAPSGAGKTSLVKALIDTAADVDVAVSHTTRPRRTDETDGVNYHFVTEKVFRNMQACGDFLESATVFGNLYGTSRAAVDRITATGRHVILEIDWQGARQIRQVMPSATTVFILPPSLDALRARLLARGQDDQATIDKRTAEAIHEISHYAEFDYIVVNDNFQTALNDLARIVHGEGDDLLLATGRDRLAPLLTELLPSSMP